jgi:hypothetical protein
VVEELLTFAPKGLAADVRLPVDVAARLRMLRAYGSQFVERDLADPVATRPLEAYVLRWRARGAARSRGGSLLASLVER